MIRSFPPHPNPLPPGERGGHSSPQQSWGVFWHILIKLFRISSVWGISFSLVQRREGLGLIRSFPSFLVLMKFLGIFLTNGKSPGTIPIRLWRIRRASYTFCLNAGINGFSKCPVFNNTARLAGIIF